MDYADTVWASCGVGDTKLLQRLQNYAARIVFKNFDFINTRGIDLVKQLKWQELADRRRFHTACLMFKCIHGIAPNYLSDQVTLLSEVSPYNTRRANSLDVIVPTVNKSIFKRSLSYNGAIIWNSIPDSIRNADDLQSFKLKYKRFYFYYFSE